MASNYFIKVLDVTGHHRIFATISEAARALQLDASNIGNVLRGKRKSAGGFKFSYTLDIPTTKIGRAYRRTRQEAAVHREFVSTVHDRLKEINQRYRNALKEGMYKSDPVLQKLMTHTDYFGATKTGGYNINTTHLNQFTTEELQNLLKVLRSEEKKYVEIAERKRRPMGRAALADLFGISEKQVQDYDAIIPAIFDLLHLAKEDAFFKYTDVQTNIFEVMQAGIDEEKLETYVDTIYEAYLGNDSQALENILLEMAGIDEEYIDPYD